MLSVYSVKSRAFLILSLIAAACYMLGVAGCSKSGSSAAATNVSINSLSPASGPFSTVVTIDGTGFSSTPSNNIVQFNHVAATVQQATATQLTVVVPKQAGTGTVTVQTGPNRVTGPVFTYVYTATVSTLAGSGTAGSADGLGTAAQFHAPAALAIDANGTLFVADLGNSLIRKVSLSGSVSTWAGSIPGGYVDSSNGLAAKFFNPSGIQVDAPGNCYVGDQINNTIRKISPSGAVSTLAGNTTAGFQDASGTAAKFFSPSGLAVDSVGNVFVADWGNSIIRKVTPSGVVTSFAGNLNTGLVNGNGTAARFNRPNDVAFDKNGNLYVADSYNNAIRKITPAGQVSTLAGTGQKGFADGAGDSAQFSSPSGIAVDAAGNVYVADFGNFRIRMITPSGRVSTVAGLSEAGTADGNAVTAQFKAPAGLALDPKGNIYVADYQGNAIRMITLE